LCWSFFKCLIIYVLICVLLFVNMEKTKLMAHLESPPVTLRGHSSLHKTFRWNHSPTTPLYSGIQIHRIDDEFICTRSQHSPRSSVECLISGAGYSNLCIYHCLYYVMCLSMILLCRYELWANIDSSCTSGTLAHISA